jgi:hypothetical protein
VKFLTKVKNKDAYIIAKTFMGRGWHAHVIGQFPLYLAERDHICSKVKFSNLPTLQFHAKSNLRMKM